MYLAFYSRYRTLALLLYFSLFVLVNYDAVWSYFDLMVSFVLDIYCVNVWLLIALL